MKLVPENINEAVKHMPGKSEEELEQFFIEDAAKIAKVDDALIFDTILDYVAREVDHQAKGLRIPYEITSQFVKYIPEEQRKEIVLQILNDFIYG